MVGYSLSNIRVSAVHVTIFLLYCQMIALAICLRSPHSSTRHEANSTTSEEQPPCLHIQSLMLLHSGSNRDNCTLSHRARGLLADCHMNPVLPYQRYSRAQMWGIASDAQALPRGLLPTPREHLMAPNGP